MRLPGTRCARAASAPCGRVPTTATASESERTPAATVERLLIVLSVAERSPPPPGRPSGHRRPVRERRAADARRRNPAARYRRPARGAMVVLKRDSRRPVEPGARRPDHLAVYMGCCAKSPEGPGEPRQVRPRRQTSLRGALPGRAAVVERESEAAGVLGVRPSAPFRPLPPSGAPRRRRPQPGEGSSRERSAAQCLGSERRRRGSAPGAYSDWYVVSRTYFSPGARRWLPTSCGARASNADSTHVLARNRS
jgi:hypothetical protein